MQAHKTEAALRVLCNIVIIDNQKHQSGDIFRHIFKKTKQVRETN